METENPGVSAFRCIYRLLCDLVGLRIPKPRKTILSLGVLAGNPVGFVSRRGLSGPWRATHLGGNIPHPGLRTFDQKSTCPDAINVEASRGANLDTSPIFTHRGRVCIADILFFFSRCGLLCRAHGLLHHSTLASCAFWDLYRE